MVEASARRRAILAATVFAVLAVAPPVVSAAGEAFLISVLTRIVIYGLAALALDFILGYGGLVSLGHAAFFGIGAYVTAVLSFHAFEETPVLAGIGGSNQALVAWPAAIGLAALAALVIGWISLRTRGVYFIMITLAFGQMLFFLFVSMQRYGGDDGLSLWWGRNDLGPTSLQDPMTFYYVCLVLLVIAYLALDRIARAPFGMALSAAMQNEERARALGVSPLRHRLIAFVISGGLAGLAGALIANQTEFVSPGLMHWTQSGQILVMVILGGMGTLIGPVLGAAALLALEEVLIPVTEHWQVVLGPILIVVVLFARRGIAGLFGLGR